MNVIELSTTPFFVIEPVALMSLTSPGTNPSPDTVTSGLVRGVPSKVLLALSDFRFTVLFVTSSFPSFLVIPVN